MPGWLAFYGVYDQRIIEKGNEVKWFILETLCHASVLVNYKTWLYKVYIPNNKIYCNGEMAYLD